MNKYTWGTGSSLKLSDLSPVLVRVLNRALGYGVIDMSIVETLRSKEDQNRAYDTKASKVKWPNSKHNVFGNQKYARAVDVYPWADGKSDLDPRSVALVTGLIMAAAAEEGIEVRSGSNWDRDGVWFHDQTFQDGVHIELCSL